MRAHPPAFAGDISGDQPRQEASPPAPGVSELPIGWADVQAIDQPVSRQQTGVDVTYTLDGKEVNGFVPVDADTYLWKDSEIAQGSNVGLILRDNRYSEALLRLNLDALPKGAQITKASLRLQVRGPEKRGAGGTLSCFRVLTPWSEDATWGRPQPRQPAQWNGLKPGQDFDATAFAQLQVVGFDDKKPGGQILSIPNFEDILQKWQSGASPNNGLLLTLNGPVVQIGFSSRESLNNSQSFVLGSASGARCSTCQNWPLLSQLVSQAGGPAFRPAANHAGQGGEGRGLSDRGERENIPGSTARTSPRRN